MQKNSQNKKVFLSAEEKELYDGLGREAMREDLEAVIQKEAFQKHMKDILEYRTMEYYRRRYTG